MSGPVRFCDCACHKSPDLQWNPVGVDMRDIIAAESACSKCVAHHRFAQLDDPPSRPLPFDLPDIELPPPPRPADATGTSEDDGN